MAEAALFGIAKSVLQQLGSAALKEFRLLRSNKEDFEKLERTVTTIQNVLKDADRKQATDARVKGWLARLRVVLYDADDFFDAISAKVLIEKGKKGSKNGKKVRHFVSKPYRFAFMVRKAHKVKEIRKRFDDIADDINKYNFLPITTDPTLRIRRDETHSFVPRNEVVGREQETEDLVRMLLPDSSQEKMRGVSVLAVIGIGGVGKTTLAKLVYNDERVQQGFDLCMWACVNYCSDLKQVLKKLVKSIPLLKSPPISEIEYYDLDGLQSLFRKEIEGKRFFLVLDDLGDENLQNWDELKQLLSSGRDGSKILTTTRLKRVAQGLRATKPYFHLEGMSDDNGWLLFKKIAFADEGDRKILELEQIGREIVRKCANIPLVIVTIAKLLREKEKKVWLPLVKDELPKVIPDDYKEIIMNTLLLSYKELPYPVKLCFGYCSLFPKDFEFEKGYLVRLWIAQGFVEPLSNRSLEDTAEEYFFCLVERRAFQLTPGDEKRKSIETYQMHDLMHDLARELAQDECISIDNTTCGSSDKTFFHVSINGDLRSMVDHVCSFSHSKSIRTFLRPCGGFTATDALKKLMSSFKSLRVLDLSETWSDIPASIGELIHLRLLDLSKNYDLKRLPGSICSLLHLQSLILRGCYRLEELPEDLGDLLNLRHLMIQGCDGLVKMPPGLAALTSLVTLDKLVVHNPSGGLNYLEGLDNLTGSLQIELPSTEWESVTMDGNGSFLSRKRRLDSLAIICRTGPDKIGIHSCYELDSLLELPPNLVILKLEGLKRCRRLPPLSSLQSLKELWISAIDSMLNIEESKSYETNSFFPSLETLSIKDMWNLRSWWMQPPTVLPTFPCLIRVSLCNCPDLTRCMPLFPQVEDLCLINVREEVIWQITGIEETSSTSHCNSVLKKLEIRESEDSHHPSINDCYRLKSIALNGLAYLTSLEYLKIEIKKWGKISFDGQEAEVQKIHLPRVRHLEIPTVNWNLFKGLKDMASLEKLLICHSFNEELQQDDGDEEWLRWEDLNKLHRVKLVFGEGFSMRNNQRLLHGFQHLTCLEELSLGKCKELYLSWRALLGLPHLQQIEIRDVEEVIDVDSDIMTIQTQPISRSIRILSIAGGSGEWVHDIPWDSFSFVKDLYLWRISNLKSLPEGIQHLAALESLRILDIPSVGLLPHWMRALSSLNCLKIWRSTEDLKKRCESGSGEDWPNIEHIPNVDIDIHGLKLRCTVLE